MKGLLLKDFYMIRKYLKMYFLITIFFIAAAFTNFDNLFVLFYPCLLSGMIPVNLMGYDERSKWDAYSIALPYERTQIVSGKYLISLFYQVTIFVLIGISQVVRMSRENIFQLNEYLLLMGMVFFISCVIPSTSLPFVFKMGVEKGRMSYFLMVGAVCGGSAAATVLFQGRIYVGGLLDGTIFLLYAGGIVLFALSWYLSIIFYKKRQF